MGFINQCTKVNELDIQEFYKLRLLLISYSEYWDSLEIDHSKLDNPLIKSVLPILKEKLDVEDDQTLIYIVGVSIILAHHDFHLMKWLNVKSINCIFNGYYVFNEDKFHILTDFIALIRVYNHYKDVNLFYKVETPVFSNINLEDCEFQYLYPDDSSYLVKLLELDFVNGDANELVIAYADYLNMNYDIEYCEIYRAFFNHEICWEFEDDSYITYKTLTQIITEYSNPLFFCFIVAYIKWKNLFEIVDDALFEYLPQVYIDGIKPFWWDCQIWSKHKSKINELVESQNFDINYYNLLDSSCIAFNRILEDSNSYRDERLLYLEPEFIYKLKEFSNFSNLMGINIRMDGNYLTKNKCENKITASDEIAIKIGKCLYGERYFEKKSEDGDYYLIGNSEDVKISKIINVVSCKRGRPSKKLINCLSSSIPKEKQDYVLSKIKEMTSGKVKKNLLLVFRVAYEVGIFSETPSRQSLIDYGYLDEELGNDVTFCKNVANDLRYKEAKDKGKPMWSNELYDKLKALKEEVCL